MRRFACVLAAGVVALTFSGAQGSILTFEKDTGAVLLLADLAASSTGYGDNINATTQGGYGYGIGAEGATPNVVADYQHVYPYPSGYGTLSNVLYRFDNVANPGTFLEVKLTAETGYKVRLHSFDLAGWAGLGGAINSIEVRDQSNTLLFSDTPASVSDTTYTRYSFATPLEGTSISIRFDEDQNLSGLTGIDNVTFSQVAAAVPEPGVLASLGMMGALLAWRRRRA